MGFKKNLVKSTIPRKEIKKKYSRFRKIQRFKRDRMEFQDLLRKTRFLRHMKPVHFLFVTPRNIFRPVYSVRARFFNKPWWPMKLFHHHEKCKVDFHAANTRGIPIDLFSLPSFLPFFLFFFFFTFVLFFFFYPLSSRLVEEDACSTATGCL